MKVIDIFTMIYYILSSIHLIKLLNEKRRK